MRVERCAFGALEGPSGDGASGRPSTVTPWVADCNRPSMTRQFVLRHVDIGTAVETAPLKAASPDEQARRIGTVMSSRDDLLGRHMQVLADRKGICLNDGGPEMGDYFGYRRDAFGGGVSCADMMEQTISAVAGCRAPSPRQHRN